MSPGKMQLFVNLVLSWTMMHWLSPACLPAFWLTRYVPCCVVRVLIYVYSSLHVSSLHRTVISLLTLSLDWMVAIPLMPPLW